MTRIVTDVVELEKIVEYVLEEGEFVFDVETIGTDSVTGADVRLDPRRNKVVWLSLATTGLSCAIPMGHPHGRQIGTTTEPRVGSDGKTRNFKVPLWSPAPRQLDKSEALGILKPLFYTEGILKGGHNVKFDLESTQKYYDDVVMPPAYFDTQGAAQLINENMHDYRLGAVLKREFGVVYDKSMGERIERYDFWSAAKYSHADSKWTWMLKRKLAPLLVAQNLDGVWRLEMDVLEVLLYMEQQGALIDQKDAAQLKHELGIRLDKIRGELFRLAGKEINFKSGPQMRALLFGTKKEGGFGLRPRVLTQGGKTGENKQPSTSASALELYAAHPFVEKYLEMQEVNKLHGTYLTAWLGGEVTHESGGKKSIEKKPSILIDGKVHASFKQFGTVTGRFSCVAADTLIDMPRDLLKQPEGVPITDVRAGDLVYAFDWRRDLVLRRVKWVAQTGVEQTVIVTVQDSMGNQRTLRATPDHLIRLWNGDWRPAGSLVHRWGDAHRNDGPRVLTMVRRTGPNDFRVVSVELGIVEPVWDMEVEDVHSFIANGINVHNCSNPNLQNIPRPGTELATRVRGLFIAPPGHSLIVADYGQIEYVVMAHFSRDPMLVRAFAEGIDLHQYVAAMVFRKDMEDVTKPERTTAKNTNFAVAYGAGDDKVAAMSKISYDDAVAFRKAHRKMLPTLYKWTERTVAECRRRKPPHITTLMGRKRRLPTIHSHSWGLRSEAERQAVNSLIQGSAADLIKLAMVRQHQLADEELRLSLSVHDELVLVVPDDRVDDGAEVMREAMLGDGVQRLLTVPMKIDMQVVKRWGDASH